MSGDILARLEATIAARSTAAPEESYVARQLGKGALKLAQKLGEEGVETAIAAAAQDDAALTGEAADLLFHLLLVLHARGIAFEAVLAELARREGQSGLAEKAGRQQ
jgi:phosphoribosyl-ATP pyrophosphohydrolase